MRSILQTCKPRHDILTGTFNPEIFTANLSQVMDSYRGKSSIIHSLYTDARQFFKDATYPTESLKMILADVLGRLAGDNSLPAIHRLETAFGGGKTHMLIALAHLSFRGQELVDAVQDIIDPTILPLPGQVQVVGIAGDELPVHQPQGAALSPYTLWGELAFQIGGEALYRERETEVRSYAAPGRNFLEQVFGGRKVLIMLDELAQYAARLQAARPDGAEMLAAFLMALHSYARTHAGVAVVLTLASAADAFAKNTEKLRELIATVKGEDVDEIQAWELAQKAEKDIRSVIARDATTVVPIQAGEISRILAKRLFDQVDAEAAAATAQAYLKLYGTHAAVLPPRASQHDFHDLIAAHYPFHPTFIRFLNEKLATVETFQGTRGVLRVLALVIRSLWQKRLETPLIHTCHVPLDDPGVVNEIMGRTGGGDLLPVLNADVGGPDSASLSLGKSYAQMADQKNPHPLGYPLYEYTWKTVFLHSLVGRTEQLNSNLFGITEAEATLAVTFPGLTPPQVKMALDKIEDIEDGALYLRFHQGRYYASLDPSINTTLNAVRRSLKTEHIQGLLDATARKIITSSQSVFHVVHDVTLPEHIPDTDKQPILAVMSLDADHVKAEDFILSAGANKPRFHQNVVFLLLPQTVREATEPWGEEKVTRSQEMLNRMEALAATVLSMRTLKAQPENFGISAAKLVEAEFDKKLKEKELGLVTTVTQAYDGLWFPSASRQIIRREIKAGVGEGGASIAEEIKRILISEGELLTAEAAVTQEHLLALGKLFFENQDTSSLIVVKENFTRQRHWPVLEQTALLPQIIRAGVNRGVWCLFRLASSESVKPEEFFSRDTGELPFDLDLTQEGWSLVTLPGAKKRGWGPAAIDKKKLEHLVIHQIEEKEAVTVKDVQAETLKNFGEVPEEILYDVIKDQLRHGKLAAYPGVADQQEKPPGLYLGKTPLTPPITPDLVLTTPAAVAVKGWVTAGPDAFKLAGTDGAHRFYPLLGRLGGLYARGAQSTIKSLELVDYETPGGGALRLTLENIPPEGMKRLEEFFEVLGGIISPGQDSEIYLEIEDPDDSCPLVQELKKSKK